MFSDLDKYYTPSDVAKKLLEKAQVVGSPKHCIDSTCGVGELLKAASEVYPASSIVGLDKDGAAIRKARKAFPQWLLSNVDVLNRRSVARSPILSSDYEDGLLVINPPFSQQGYKSLECNLLGENIKTSVAMAYLAKSLEIFAPSKGVVMVAPESLLYSDVDAKARSLLSSIFNMEEVMGLKTTTFRGARVHASVVYFKPGDSSFNNSQQLLCHKVIDFSLLRGTLPVFRAEKVVAGLPFLHSTDLSGILSGESLSSLPKVMRHGSSQIKGHVILLPRVGVPSFPQCRNVYFDQYVQLSDCVFALQFSCLESAGKAASRLNSSWGELCGIYRGTGARYVTRTRLLEYLNNHGLVARGLGSELAS